MIKFLMIAGLENDRFSSETLYTSPASLIQPKEHQRTFAKRQGHSIRHTSRAASSLTTADRFSSSVLLPIPFPITGRNQSIRRSVLICTERVFFLVNIVFLSFCPFAGANHRFSVL